MVGNSPDDQMGEGEVGGRGCGRWEVWGRGRWRRWVGEGVKWGRCGGRTKWERRWVKWGRCGKCGGGVGVGGGGRGGG